MAFRDFLDDEVMRPRILLGGMLLVFVLCWPRSWRIQVAHGQSYQQDLMRQSVRRVRIPGIRGKFWIAIPSVWPTTVRATALRCIWRICGAREMGPHAIDVVEKQLDEIAAIIGKPRQISREDIQIPHSQTIAVAAGGLARHRRDCAGATGRAESLLPGVDILVEPVRVYPRKGSACHVLGYVGRADAPAEEDEEPYHYYLPEMAGRSGIEKRFDEWLRGEPGGKLVRVDVSGFRHDDLAVRDPRDGRTVRLSLDARIQELSEKVLEGRNGALWWWIPPMATCWPWPAPGFRSQPVYSRHFVRRVGGHHEQSRDPAGEPGGERRFSAGQYIQNGSGAGSHAERGRRPENGFFLSGHFDLGRARFRCWYTPGHGLLDMRQAIQRSCNVYFFRLGLLADTKRSITWRPRWGSENRPASPSIRKPLVCCRMMDGNDSRLVTAGGTATPATFRSGRAF
jgi:penicillin-binding protein 2